MADELETAHRDGYRVVTETTEADQQFRVDFYLNYIQAGLCVRSEHLATRRFPASQHVEELPLIERERKLLAAMARFFNEGGDRDRFDVLGPALRNCVGQCGATVQLSPACIESEETHARTFRLPDGQYLRVVEDAFSEVMTIDEMAMAMEQDLNAPESSGFGFIP